MELDFYKPCIFFIRDRLKQPSYDEKNVKVLIKMYLFGSLKSLMVQKNTCSNNSPMKTLIGQKKQDLKF